jgi:SAM-dependent methyltransferase
MGNSSYEGKEWTSFFVQSVSKKIKSVLDIGPGQGTYHYFLNKYIPDATWACVEVWKPYISSFNLDQRYTDIYNEDIRTFDVANNTYDLVIAGDVLEHMSKDDAINVFAKFKPVCKYFIISIPIVKWPQEALNDNPYEVHVKDDWSHDEVMGTFPSVGAFFSGQQIGVYVLKGDL